MPGSPGRSSRNFAALALLAVVALAAVGCHGSSASPGPGLSQAQVSAASKAFAAKFAATKDGRAALRAITPGRADLPGDRLAPQQRLHEAAPAAHEGRLRHADGGGRQAGGERVC